MNKVGRYIVFLLGTAIIGFLLWYFNSIIAYILIAAILSLIGHPLVAFLDKIKIGKVRIPRAFSAAFTLLLIWAVLFGFFRLFIPIIASEAQRLSNVDSSEIINNLEEPLNAIEKSAKKIGLFTDSDESIKEYATKSLVKILNISDLSNIFETIAEILGNIFVAFFAISFITFFFLKDEHMFYNIVMTITPTKYEEPIKNALHAIKRLLMRYFIGISIDVTIVITLVTIGLSIVGLKLEHALIIALFAGLMNVIPYIGPLLGIVFGLIIGTLTHLDMNFYSELLPLLGYMLIVFVTIQILDATLLQPTIYSSSVKAHPLEIFLLILTAGSVAGIAGMILAIPTYTVLRVVAKEFFNQFKVVKKLTKNI